MKTRFRKPFSLVLGAILLLTLLLVATSCTPEQTQAIEGILKNVDSVNGEITIQTKDGKDITLTIDTEAAVQTEGGAPSSIESLEPGAFVEIETGKDKEDSAKGIKVHIAKVKGIIVGVSSGDITVESKKDGQQVTVNISADTQIKLEGDILATTDELTVGTMVEVKYDPESFDAFKIHIDSEEEAEIEGTITAINSGNVTIQAEKGRTLTLVVSSTTQIEDGTIADLEVGGEVEAKFDPFNLAAFSIEIEDKDDTEVKGSADEDEKGNHKDDIEVKEEDEDESSETADIIPHPLDGRDDCLLCHGETGLKPYPADHAGRTSDTCLTCHQQSS